MKLVSAIIRPHRLEHVRDALQAAGVGGLSVCEARGVERQARPAAFRGIAVPIDTTSRLRIEVVCVERDVDAIISAIVGSARTQTLGDGTIFVTQIDDVMRIRTGEVGVDAL
jgi:nitrogen regulatory protein PII